MNSVLTFDSVHSTWREASPMPEVRFHFAACAIGRNIFVFGGKDSDYIAQSSVYKFDTAVDAWSVLPPMPYPCSPDSASVLDGLAYVQVGRGGVILRFDPAQESWLTIAPNLIQRGGANTFVLDCCLYVVGGLAFGAEEKIVECYDVASNTWTDVSSMLEGRRVFEAVVVRSSGPPEAQDLFDALIAKASSGRS
jgi:N-acetylneuraminic acid mutarotase